jgi:hypothetical protein
MRKADPTVNRSKVFAIPSVIGLRRDKSRALRVGKSQIARANEVAKSMGCGEPFTETGHPEFTTPEKQKYMRELNKRRVDQGESRLVNFDGGYGDET